MPLTPKLTTKDTRRTKSTAVTISKSFDKSVISTINGYTRTKSTTSPHKPKVKMVTTTRTPLVTSPITVEAVPFSQIDPTSPTHKMRSSTYEYIKSARSMTTIPIVISASLRETTASTIVTASLPPAMPQGTSRKTKTSTSSSIGTESSLQSSLKRASPNETYEHKIMISPTDASTLFAVGQTTSTPKEATSVSAVSDSSLATETTTGNLIIKAVVIFINAYVAEKVSEPIVSSTMFMLFMLFGAFLCMALAAFVVILVLYRRHQRKHKSCTLIPTGSNVDGALKKACAAAEGSGNLIPLREISSVNGVKSEEKKEEHMQKETHVEQDLSMSPASPAAVAAGELLVVDVGTPSTAERTPIAIEITSPPTPNDGSSTLSNEKSNQLLVTVQIEPVPMKKAGEKGTEETLVAKSGAVSDANRTKSATDDDTKKVRTDGALANNVRQSKPEPENERSDTKTARTPEANKETRIDKVPENRLKAEPEAESHDETSASTRAPGESSTNDDAATTTVHKSPTALPSDNSNVPVVSAGGGSALNEPTSDPQAFDADKEAKDFFIEGGPQLLEKILSKT